MDQVIRTRQRLIMGDSDRTGAVDCCAAGADNGNVAAPIMGAGAARGGAIPALLYPADLLRRTVCDAAFIQRSFCFVRSGRLVARPRQTGCGQPVIEFGHSPADGISRYRSGAALQNQKPTALAAVNPGQRGCDAAGRDFQAGAICDDGANPDAIAGDL